MSETRVTTLPNGLRVVTDTVDGMHSAAIGIWTGVGTRDEDMSENGVAHMVEHMLFKGTKKRNALEIVEKMEDVGGSMNAYTSREVTSYHIHLLKEDVPLGMDILADMYQNSIMPDDEIEREREVIIQEIGMNNDTPDDLVYDHYFERAYPGQAMGAPILGTSGIIENMQRSSLEEYISRFYSPTRTVISAAGGVSHDEIVDMAADLYTNLPKGDATEGNNADYKGGDMRTEKDLEQAHIVLGFQGIARPDEDYFAVQALSTLLGGGMSSRLFQEVREKRGLVYSIYSFHFGYQDDGLFEIMLARALKLDEIIPVICDEVQKLAASVTEQELERAKAQLRAGMFMGRESMMTRADQQAKHMLFRNRPFDENMQLCAINDVDLKALRRVCNRIFKTAPTLAALGPLEKLEPFDKIVKRLAG